MKTFPLLLIKPSQSATEGSQLLCIKHQLFSRQEDGLGLIKTKQKDPYRRRSFVQWEFLQLSYKENKRTLWYQSVQPTDLGGTL